MTAPFPLLRRQARRHVNDLPFVPGGRLLDVGCGNGRLLVEMRWAGWDVEGVEVDPDAARSARAHGLSVRQGAFEQLDLPEGSYDAITMDHVLEHLADPAEALAKCHALLRPGGALRIATPNLGSPAHRAYGSDWIGLDPPRHLALVNARALRATLERAGFAVEFLPPMRVRWALLQSEQLRAPGRGIPRGRALRLAVHGAFRDLRALVRRTSGEELVVLARR